MPRPPLHRLWTAAARRLLIHRRPVAAVCAALAVVLSLQILRPAEPVREQVQVAARDLPAGHQVGSADLRTVGFDPALVPDGQAADPVGSVLASPLRRGEVVTDARVLGPGLTTGSSALVALPVRIPDAGAVQVLQVGDAVDLIAVPAALGPGDSAGSTERVVARAARILALPKSPEGTSPAGPTGGQLVVLAVPRDDTVEIATAAARDWLTVALAP